MSLPQTLWSSLCLSPWPHLSTLPSPPTSQPHLPCGTRGPEQQVEALSASCPHPHPRHTYRCSASRAFWAISLLPPLIPWAWVPDPQPSLELTPSSAFVPSLPSSLPPTVLLPPAPLFQPSLVGPSKGRPAFSLGQESQGLPYGFPESPGYILSLVLAGVSLSLSPTPCPPPPTPLCLPSPAAPLSTSFCSPSLPLPWFSP